MLGVTLLVFVLLLMILFVVASFFLSKAQKVDSNTGNELDEFHQRIIGQMEKSPN